MGDPLLGAFGGGTSFFWRVGARGFGEGKIVRKVWQGQCFVASGGRWKGGPEREFRVDEAVFLRVGAGGPGRVKIKGIL